MGMAFEAAVGAVGVAFLVHHRWADSRLDVDPRQMLSDAKRWRCGPGRRGRGLDNRAFTWVRQRQKPRGGKDVHVIAKVETENESYLRKVGPTAVTLSFGGIS